MPFSSVLGASSVIKPGVCTSTTRPTVPYEGQLIYETDTDRVASYNGSAWVYGSFTGGLVLVKSQTIGSAVSSVEVTNAFSSTYDNYIITVTGGVGSITQNLAMTLGATTSDYYMGGAKFNYASASTTALNTNNGASWARAFTVSANTLDTVVYLFSPNLAKRTTMVCSSGAADTGEGYYHHGGFLNNTTQYTAFTLTAASGQSMTGGTIRVYGYSNS